MRVPVLVGDLSEDVVALLRECGHEPILVEGTRAALAALGGENTPPVVVTDHESDRRALIRALRETGAWVIGAGREVALERLAQADDLLPLPAEAAALRARLRVAGRSTTVGTLAGGVAHEINNPLAVTHANIEFVLGELSETGRPPDIAESIQALREALESARRVAGIVRELSAFARGDRRTRFGVPARELAEVARPTLLEATTAPRRGQILVVDDEPLIGRSVERILSVDHQVVVETDARKALARIGAGERFDVILCDLMMPNMSGMELYAELGRSAPEQQKRIVFLTGGAFTSAAQTFLESLPDPWLSKPFEAAALEAAIASRLS